MLEYLPLAWKMIPGRGTDLRRRPDRRLDRPEALAKATRASGRRGAGLLGGRARGWGRRVLSRPHLVESAAHFILAAGLHECVQPGGRPGRSGCRHGAGGVADDGGCGAREPNYAARLRQHSAGGSIGGVSVLQFQPGHGFPGRFRIHADRVSPGMLRRGVGAEVRDPGRHDRAAAGCIHSAAGCFAHDSKALSAQPADFFRGPRAHPSPFAGTRPGAFAGSTGALSGLRGGGGLRAAPDASLRGTVLRAHHSGYLHRGLVGIRQLRYAEFGMASRLLFGGELQRTLGGQIRLEMLAEKLGEAQSEEDCWRVLAASIDDFGFSRRSSFRSADTDGRRASQALRIRNVGRCRFRSAIKTGCGSNARSTGVLPMMVTPFLDTVRRALQSKLQNWDSEAVL